MCERVLCVCVVCMCEAGETLRESATNVRSECFTLSISIKSSHAAGLSDDDVIDVD